MTYEEMLTLLKQGGCHTESFDESSLKTLAMLYREVMDLDVTLDLRNYHDRQRVFRTALNVRAVIVWKDAHDVSHYLCEIGRVYRRMVNGEMREDTRWEFKPYGISETRKRGEDPLRAIHRAFYEEYRIAGIEQNIINCAAPEIHDIHESKVYENVMSDVCTQWFVYEAPYQFHPGGLLNEPDGSQVRVAWFSEYTLSQKGLLEVLMARNVAPFPLSIPSFNPSTRTAQAVRSFYVRGSLSFHSMSRPALSSIGSALRMKRAFPFGTTG